MVKLDKAVRDALLDALTAPVLGEVSRRQDALVSLERMLPAEAQEIYRQIERLNNEITALAIEEAYVLGLRHSGQQIGLAELLGQG